MAMSMAVRDRVSPRGIGHDLRTVRIVVHRELIRFSRDNKRAVAMLLQACLWLFVMGTGLSTLVADTPGADMQTYLFPGVIAMAVILTATTSAASVVWDREFGFLREMLVAPVNRTAIVLGKVLGGALLATAQGAMVLALAGMVGVPYDLGLIATLLGEMFVAAFTVTAFGVMMAAGIRSIESFFGVIQMMVMPLLFLSGALFPIGDLPPWLAVLTRLNPLTYAVAPMRHAVFDHVDSPASVRAAFDPDLYWFSWSVPVAAQLLVLGGAGVLCLSVAVARFRRTN